MTDRDRLSHLLDANSAVLDLSLSAAQREGVLAYLALAESMHRGLLAVSLEPADESAVVFVPQVTS